MLPETVAAELDRPFEGVDKLIEDVDVEVALGNKKIESRMQGMQKSRLLMDRLNEALTVLRKSRTTANGCIISSTQPT